MNPNYSSSPKSRDWITKLDFMTHQYLLNQLAAKTKSMTETGQDSFFWLCFSKIFLSIYVYFRASIESICKKLL